MHDAAHRHDARTARRNSSRGVRRTAVVIGASSGIGAALARELGRDGWRLALLARRVDRLEALRAELGPETIIRALDVSRDDSSAVLEQTFEELGSADLVVITAGTGHLNRALASGPDAETIGVNVEGFAAAARAAMRHFLEWGEGHLVGVSSVAALRGSGVAAAYAASKAFQSVYLDGLRDLARRSGRPIAVTEVKPGFVDTDMLKSEAPLPSLVRRFLVASPELAARQIAKAVRKRAKHVYVTRRYGLIALMMRLMPRPG